MIKLIATDIDGTLLDNNRDISPTTREIFENIDLPKVLISARMPQAMYYLQEALDIMGSPLVCYNGALVLHREEELYNRTIVFQDLKALALIGQQHQLHVSLYRGKEWFVPQLDEWSKREINNTRTQPTVQDLEVTLEYFNATKEKGGVHKIMFMGDAAQMDLAFAKAEQEFSQKVHLYRSKDTYTEISPKEISKKTALELLLKSRFENVELENVAAFGDNYNDIEMLESVGYGVAVGNARQEVKNAAQYVTSHHKEDGVARWLQQELK